MTVGVGETAPDFELMDQGGAVVKLADFRGERNVVLVFFPLAFSGICEGELCSIRDELADLAESDDVQVLAVSVDSMFAHRAWADQQGYKFPLLADFWPHGAVAKAYGVFEESRGVAKRGTFVIDKSGTVRWSVVNGIPDARDTGEYRAALAAL